MENDSGAVSEPGKIQARPASAESAALEAKDVVLIVDDEPVSLKLLVRRLESTGMKVLVAADAQAALDLASRSPPDIILLDVLLPDVNGFDLYQRLRALPPTAETPVIFLSGLTDPEEKLKGLELGAVDYISKMYDIREVVLRVRRHLQWHRLQRTLEAKNTQLEQEINKRKQADKKLRVWQQQLEQQNLELRTLWQAMEQGPATVVVTDVNGAILYVNPRFTETTGYSIEEALGQNPRILKSGEHSREYYEQLWQTILAGNIWRGTFHNRRKDGTLYWEEASIGPVYNNQGQITNFIAVKEEISARKQAEDALKQHMTQLEVLRKMSLELTAQLEIEQLLRSIIERATELLAAHAGVLLFYNADEDHLYQASGTSDSDAFPPLLERGQGVGGKVLETSRSLRVADYSRWEGRVPGLEQECISIIGTPIVWAGRVQGVLEVWRNEYQPFQQAEEEFLELFTAHAAIAIQNASLYERARADMLTLRRLNSELVHRNDELDAFAHTVAHDINGPLGAIISGMGFLKSALGQDGDEELAQLAHMLLQSCQKLARITQELMLLTGVRKQSVTLRSLNMAVIVEEVVKRVEMMEWDEAPQIIVSESGTWPRALGYAAWIEEVWMNYLTNAIKYGGSPPRVELGAYVEEDHRVRFWVKDNGPGLTPEQQSKLFAPFERLSQARARGYGLGLSIVERIIEKLGGEVGVESQPGQGSTFYFRLPQA